MSKFAIMGLPASGKGTQAEILSKEFNLTHISTGDLIRELINMKKADEFTYNQQKTAHCKAINLLNDYNPATGKYMSDTKMIEILKQFLPEDNYLLDGFPRTIQQVDAVDIDLVIFINVRKETALKRMLSRNQNRSDDNVRAFQRRLNEFQEKTQPVIDEFRKRGQLIEVDGERGFDLVYETIKIELQQYFPEECWEPHKSMRIK
ncbi:hypothetical protein NUSPORA_00971 [Nucleospora cyclopteri]